MAAHEKAVLFVLMPSARKAIPRTRKTCDIFRLFCFIDFLSAELIV